MCISFLPFLVSMPTSVAEITNNCTHFRCQRVLFLTKTFCMIVCFFFPRADFLLQFLICSSFFFARVSVSFITVLHSAILTARMTVMTRTTHCVFSSTTDTVHYIMWKIGGGFTRIVWGSMLDHLS